MSNKKTVVVYNPIRFSGEAWLPVLWAQAKTYYERNGVKVNDWNWAPCYTDLHGDDLDQTKLVLEQIKPDVFCISLYVWNYTVAHVVAKWVKQTWPNCLVVTGGPHQYFKHDDAWFKNHPYIDASLPGECSGELAIQQILDHIRDDGSIDWSQVTDICYPSGKSRYPMHSTKKSTAADKKTFDYNWSAFDSQFQHLKDYLEFAQQHRAGTKALSIFETTRGCPYGCTYCDWGGGINTKVLQKPMDAVERDIQALCKLNLNYLYFADANFGIFGERDVSIIKKLAQARKQNLQTFSVGYGGFAKTENKLPYIKQILKLDIKHGLSVLGEIKISMQSLDVDVLKRIDRKNVPLEKQIQTLQELSSPWKRLPIYVELIQGLPGMTLEKFYQELNILGDQKLSVQWYPWIVLPEAPAYSAQYRRDQGLGTIVKTAGWWTHEDETNNWNEIVIESSTYTKDHYLEMVLSSGLYKLFVQGGYLHDTVEWLRKTKNISLGALIQDIHNNYAGSWLDLPRNTWNNQILQDTSKGCFVTVDDQEVYLGLYFVALAFLYHNDFTVGLANWLQQRYQVPASKLARDLKLAIHKENFGVKTGRIFKVDYSKEFFNLPNNLEKMLLMFIQFKHSGSAIRASHSFIV